MKAVAAKPKYLPVPVGVELCTVSARAPMLTLLAVFTVTYLGVSLFVFQSIPAYTSAAFVLLICAWTAWQEAARVALTRLEWSRQKGWSCVMSSEPDGAPALCAPRVLLDFQSLMLIRIDLNAAPKRVWVWMYRSDARQWHLLRCAFFGPYQT